MTEWDHHDPTPGDPGWTDAAHPDPLAGPGDDPYGTDFPAEPADLPEPTDLPEPADSPADLPAEGTGLPAERADLPAEGSAAWSDGPDHTPGSWPGDGTDGADGTDAAGGTDHGAVPPGDPADLPDSTDPAAWTDGADADPFPPALDLDVTPADGGPWTDPELIGGTADWSADPTDPPAALRSDLAAADGDPDAGWAALQDSDDPAVRALATHWQG